MAEYNEDLQVERIGNQLEGVKIALGVTGGIAAIEVPKIARHFRRFGAQVHACMTPESYKFIGEASVQWGTNNPVVSGLTGRAEHICLEDLVVIAPATTNTINKIFAGIADNSVTTLVASALGMHKPIYIVPTMHHSLYQNPFLQENLAKANKYGIRVVAAREGENKIKMPRISELVKYVMEDYQKYAGGKK